MKEVKIVQLSNGKYAVERGFFIKQYADIDDLKYNNDIFWWTNLTEFSNHCVMSNYEELLNIVKRYKKTNKKPKVINKITLDY